MSVQWLAVQSFQHSQDLLAAINALSIYLKLEASGLSDDKQTESAKQARNVLMSFLKTLKPVVSEIEGEELKPVLGVDPRLRQLAKSFLSAKRNHRRFRSALFKNQFSQFEQLLQSKQAEDREPLLESLKELRVLIEEHVHVDADRVLGEF
ncbi:MAG: hypothetical protein U1F76_18365 [Candidatus Competibacteraceae bacterium]